LLNRVPSKELEMLVRTIVLSEDALLSICAAESATHEHGRSIPPRLLVRTASLAGMPAAAPLPLPLSVRRWSLSDPPPPLTVRRSSFAPRP
jgi:hypothetical protein